jgi:hypothetical protein
MDKLDKALIIIGSLILLFLGGLLLFSLIVQVENYKVSMQQVMDGKPLDYAALIMTTRALDLSIVKICSLFLAFLLIFLGAIYILRTSREIFKLKAENSNIKGSFETSSPGLAMIFMGVVLVMVVLFSKSYMEYVPPGSHSYSEDNRNIDLKAREFK